MKERMLRLDVCMYVCTVCMWLIILFELTYLCVCMNMRYGYCHCNIHVTMTTSTGRYPSAWE